MPSHRPISVYPIFLTGLSGKLAVVVGGGPVGERKARGLLAAGLTVKLVSPTATGALTKMAERGEITWLDREASDGDLEGAFLIFAATDRREINRELAETARRMGILCNVADAPDEGDFHVPALLRRPDATIAVGTGGASPRAAKAVRDRIRQLLDKE